MPEDNEIKRDTARFGFGINIPIKDQLGLTSLTDKNPRPNMEFNPARAVEAEPKKAILPEPETSAVPDLKDLNTDILFGGNSAVTPNIPVIKTQTQPQPKPAAPVPHKERAAAKTDLPAKKTSIEIRPVVIPATDIPPPLKITKTKVFGLEFTNARPYTAKEVADNQKLIDAATVLSSSNLKAHNPKQPPNANLHATPASQSTKHPARP